MRRLSPTAVRDTGNLRRPEGMEDPHTNEKNNDALPGSFPGLSASNSNAAMPSYTKEDAAEPRAGGRDESVETDESSRESSLTPTPSDGDDHREATIPTSDVVEEQYTSDSTPARYKNRNVQKVPDGQCEGDTLESQNLRITDGTEYVEQRMEYHSKPRTNEEPVAGTSKDKGKGIDPRNWGEVHFEDPDTECNPQIQQEILAECNAAREPKPQPPNPITKHNALTANVGDIAGGEPQREEEAVDEGSPAIVTRKDVLNYLKDKKRLQREIDRRQKKDKTSHHKRKERAGSEPLSEELAALIQRVAEGSQKKQKYKPECDKRVRKTGERAATKPITQVAAKSALGRALKQMGAKGPRNEDSDSESPSDESSSDSDTSSSGYSSDSSDSTSSDSSSGSSSRSPLRSRSR